MDIVSFCPFVVSKLVWQAHTGAFALTVIVKATFVLQSGTSTLALTQDPALDEDRFHDHDPRRSVRIPNDRVPYKPRADVLLVGHAYAPSKTPVRSLMTRFVVGEMDKSIEVWCDRAFRILDAQLLEGKRFVQMPMVWERASGGPESANPVGKRFDALPDGYGTIPIANLQPPGHFVSKRSDMFVPTCYAPIAPTWPGRTQRLGRLSRSFFEGRWEDRPFPQDVDPTFFQAAPPDQIVAEIRPNERIVLEHLHPEESRLVTSLPGLRPRAIADRATGEREEISLVGDTLWVDSDRGVCCVVWRGRIGLRHAHEAGRIAVWVDGMPMAEPRVLDSVSLGLRPRPDQGLSVPGPGPASAGPVAVCPLRGQTDQEARDLSSTPSQGISQVMDEEPDVVMTMIGTQAKNGAALPFVAGGSSLAEARTAMATEVPKWADATNNDATGTMLGTLANSAAKALPFEHQRDSADSLEQTIPPVPTTNVAMPFATPIAAHSTFEPPVQYGNERIALAEPIVQKHVPVRADEPQPAKVEVAPPAMIGPLAKVEMIPREETKAEEPVASTQPAPKAPPTEAPKKFNPADFPLERCAALTASIARTKPNKATILEAEKLTEKEWETIKTYWAEAIKEETKRGRCTMLNRFDEAYVGQLEKERGTITVEEYARLSVAGERGTLDEVLKELGLPRGAVARLERKWLKRFAYDLALAERLENAMITTRAT